MMHWPVPVDWGSKVVKDIESSGVYDLAWFIRMKEEGFRPPTDWRLVFPQGHWWVWGN